MNLFPVLRVVFVFIPFLGVMYDIFANSIQFVFVSNDTFPSASLWAGSIIPLPQFPGRRWPIVLFNASDIFVCRNRFECSNNFTQRRGQALCLPFAARQSHLGYPQVVPLRGLLHSLSIMIIAP